MLRLEGATSCGVQKEERLQGGLDGLKKGGNQGVQVDALGIEKKSAMAGKVQQDRMMSGDEDEGAEDVDADLGDYEKQVVETGALGGVELQVAHLEKCTAHGDGGGGVEDEFGDVGLQHGPHVVVSLPDPHEEQNHAAKKRPRWHVKINRRKEEKEKNKQNIIQRNFLQLMKNHSKISW